MSSKPLDTKWSPIATKGRTHRRQACHGVSPPASSAIDEAFADLSLQPEEAPAQSPNDSQGDIRRNQAMVAGLVTQLEALERQRLRLASLLEKIEPDSSPLHA